MIKAVKKDTVKVRYTGRLANGTEFDRSPDDRPLLFILGQNEVIPGFDAAVEGMYQGERKTVKIPCEQAYGKSRPELIEKVERTLIGDKVQLQVGGQLEITGHDNSVLRVMVREISEEHVVLDANHPLADQELVFDIELLEVKKAD